MGEQKQGWPEAPWPEAGWPGAPHVARKGHEPRELVLCSEDLYSWWDGGEGVTY